MSVCGGCGSPMKTIPAGTSKSTGNPYPAFEACSKRCGYKPPKPMPVSHSPVTLTGNNRELLKIASDLAINGANDDIFEIIKANMVKLIRLEQDANYLATKKPDEQASPEDF